MLLKLAHLPSYVLCAMVNCTKFCPGFGSHWEPQKVATGHIGFADFGLNSHCKAGGLSGTGCKVTLLSILGFQFLHCIPKAWYLYFKAILYGESLFKTFFFFFQWVWCFWAIRCHTSQVLLTDTEVISNKIRDSPIITLCQVLALEGNLFYSVTCDKITRAENAAVLIRLLLIIEF